MLNATLAHISNKDVFNTVDGRNLAQVDMEKYPIFSYGFIGNGGAGFLPSTVTLPNQEV